MTTGIEHRSLETPVTDRKLKLNFGNATLSEARLSPVQREPGAGPRLMVRFVKMTGPVEDLFQPDIPAEAMAAQMPAVLFELVQPALKVAHRLRVLLNGSIETSSDTALENERQKLVTLADDLVDYTSRK